MAASYYTILTATRHAVCLHTAFTLLPLDGAQVDRGALHVTCRTRLPAGVRTAGACTWTTLARDLGSDGWAGPAFGWDNSPDRFSLLCDDCWTFNFIPFSIPTRPSTLYSGSRLVIPSSSPLFFSLFLLNPFNTTYHSVLWRRGPLDCCDNILLFIVLSVICSYFFCVDFCACSIRHCLFNAPLSIRTRLHWTTFPTLLPVGWTHADARDTPGMAFPTYPWHAHLWHMRRHAAAGTRLALNATAAQPLLFAPLLPRRTFMPPPFCLNCRLTCCRALGLWTVLRRWTWVALNAPAFCCSSPLADRNVVITSAIVSSTAFHLLTCSIWPHSNGHFLIHHLASWLDSGAAAHHILAVYRAATSRRTCWHLPTFFRCRWLPRHNRLQNATATPAEPLFWTANAQIRRHRVSTL